MNLRSAVCSAAVLALFCSPAFGYTAQKVSGGGALKGKITFSGAVPEPTKIPITKNPEVCGTGTRIIREVTVGAGGGLQHAVVFFNKIETGKDWAKPKIGWQLNQKTCTFIPWVQVIPDRSELEVVNRDPVLHNIHTYELIPAGSRMVRVTMFNEAQPTQGYTFRKTIRMRRGNTIKIECDAHNFMHAYALALKNPYFAISSADGSYSIGQVPPGKYKVTIWHSKLGVISKEVEIKSGQTVEVNHQYTAK